MKKTIAIILVLTMLFACGCGGGSEAPQKDDRYDAVKPAENEEAVTLYDSTLDQTFTLSRVTTSSREDAQQMLDVIYPLHHPLRTGRTVCGQHPGQGVFQR